MYIITLWIANFLRRAEKNSLTTIYVLLVGYRDRKARFCQFDLKNSACKSCCSSSVCVPTGYVLRGFSNCLPWYSVLSDTTILSAVRFSNNFSRSRGKLLSPLRIYITCKKKHNMLRIWLIILFIWDIRNHITHLRVIH